MSAILKLDFQERKQLRFSEVNYLNYTKKTHGPIPHPLNNVLVKVTFL